MKLISVQYLGFTAMDRRFSNPMLPWIVSEIRKRDSYEQVSLGAEDGTLQAYNTDFELQFSHKIQNITRYSQADSDPNTFLYLLRDDDEQLLYCYLFQAYRTSDVADLYQQMREQSTVANPPSRSMSRSMSLTGSANLTSLCVDISPSSSHFFEVLYIGKIKVSHRKVPDSFIDDALDKFKHHEVEKGKLRRDSQIPHFNPEDIRRGSLDSTVSDTGSVDSVSFSQPLSSSDNESKSDENSNRPRAVTSPDSGLGDQIQTLENVLNEQKPDKEQNSNSSEEIFRSKSEVKIPTDSHDHNRTMVLQVGRIDLRLISPDRKLILLHKHHRDIATCIQGLRNAEHFGFICKENNMNNLYIGYVFKCECSSVASDAVGAISAAFAVVDSKVSLRPSPIPIAIPIPSVTTCEHCPMIWYHRLCNDVEHLSDRKTQAAIFRRIDLLDEDEQNIILTKFRGAETDSIREQNEFLMMLLRAHCEMKQNRHVHDTAENRSEFLNQYLGGSTIFMKAKRSLSNSFDHLLKRKGSRDDFGPILKDLNLPVAIGQSTREGSPQSPTITPTESDRDSDGSRSRASTIGSVNDLRDRDLKLNVKDNMSRISPERNAPDKNLKSPMMDIFMKVGNSPKSTCSEDSPKNDVSGSWRQAIFNRVVTPHKKEEARQVTGDSNSSAEARKSKEELRQLWNKSIHQARLLVRMEKENAKLKARQEETAVKRIKLEYDEMNSCQREVVEVWELLVSKESRCSMKCDNQMLLQAIRQGVPRGKRGEVWQFLAEQHCLKQPPIDTTKFPNYNVPYESLLKQLTSHQHAILIDLGRTFPSHSYFSSPLGPGQLALFNLLKAYSLLDPEVGYCQGLSFVAGVLLLHMEESEAFYLLRHLMFRRGMRAQYLPDMVALQIQLYQLSRLLHDLLPDLYDHLDVYEVAPTLYAAPWVLTLFASQFPLGFVTRVFDLLFLESTDVVFKVALALLTHHKEALLACDNFEEIMNYLKNNLPTIDKPTLDKIMKQVFTCDISRQLNEYKVEYQVLQEEMTSVKPQIDELHKLQAENKTLAEQNKALMAQLEISLSNVQRLERNRTLQQATINRLEVQSRGLEVSVVTLGTFIDTLVENKVDVQIPGEVRRIVAQIMVGERRKTDTKLSQSSSLIKTISNGTQIFKKSENNRPLGKTIVKSLSTGKLGLTVPDNLSVPRSVSLNSQSDLEKNLKNSQLAQNLMFPERGFPLKVIDDNDTYDNIRQRTVGNSNLKTSQTVTKPSHFFSNSHNQILHHRLGGHEEKKSQIIDQFYSNSSTIKEIIREDSRENLQQNVTGLLLEDHVTSPTSSIDSGVETPGSPPEGPHHPLSSCDVNFTYNGTIKLKNIRSIRNLTRNSSPDLLGK